MLNSVWGLVQSEGDWNAWTSMHTSPKLIISSGWSREEQILWIIWSGSSVIARLMISSFPLWGWFPRFDIRPDMLPVFFLIWLKLDCIKAVSSLLRNSSSMLLCRVSELFSLFCGGAAGWWILWLWLITRWRIRMGWRKILQSKNCQISLPHAGLLQIILTPLFRSSLFTKSSQELLIAKFVRKLQKNVPDQGRDFGRRPWRCGSGTETACSQKREGHSRRQVFGYFKETFCHQKIIADLSVREQCAPAK